MVKVESAFIDINKKGCRKLQLNDLRSLSDRPMVYPVPAEESEDAHRFVRSPDRRSGAGRGIYGGDA